MNISLFLRSLFHVYVPQLCRICGEELLSGERELCRKCLDGLPRTFFEIEKDNICEQRFWGVVDMHSVFSIYYFRRGEWIQRLIHKVKYNRCRELGIVLGEEIGRIMLQNDLVKDYNMLVPIPLHYKKQALRGYNQAQLLAEGISNITGLPVCPDIIKKHIDNSTQTHKDKYERYLNTHDVYSLCVSCDTLSNKHILLVDDVLTTGNTAAACARLFSNLPNTYVGVVTLGLASI